MEKLTLSATSFGKENQRIYSNRLAHSGVRGMRWGVRNEEKPSGTTGKGKKDQTALAKENVVKASQLRKHLIAKGADEKAFKKDYGDESFLQRHKTGIAIGATVVGVAAVAGAAYALRGKDIGSYLRKPLTISLEENWRKPVDLPSGSILTRLSTKAETTPNPGGFYCAYRKDDVTRYRAAFTGFVGASKGISNEYQATTPVHAPSGFRTVAEFKALAHKDPEFAKLVVGRGGISRTKTLDQITEREWHNALRSHAATWSGDEHASETVKFFTHLKGKGYNAVIDFNNAGVISQTPLRVIDGSGFKVAKSTKLSQEDIAEALRFYENDPLIHSSESAGRGFFPITAAPWRTVAAKQQYYIQIFIDETSQM